MVILDRLINYFDLQGLRNVGVPTLSQYRFWRVGASDLRKAGDDRSPPMAAVRAVGCVAPAPSSFTDEPRF
jgi:hypothetical protein